MNKKIIVENLEQLIEEHKKEKIPYKTYEFDNASYTLLLIDINQLIKQLEEKDKIINKVSERLKLLGKYDGETCTRNFKMMSADFNQLIEWLERGKNANVAN